MSQTAENLELPLLTNPEWELRATSVEERDELMAYAEERGAPTWPAKGQCDPEALLLGWLGDLMAYDAAYDSEGPMTTPEQFRAMCDAYAATR